jgi:two-component sensor histidine kinase
MKAEVTVPKTELDGEMARLAAIRRYDILDTPPDGAFDRITAIAARHFDVPISIISIVDENRIWFKSHHGVEVDQVGRDLGLCASAILSGDPWILTDAKNDVRALTNPLVAGEFGLRFYVGIPLQSSDGFNLGTLCVIDREPRPVNASQIADLKDLASIVMDQMELRLSARTALAQASILSREIDHRVMNSLQFVSSMLTMQARATSNPETTDHLQDAASRVNAVARVHHHFQLEESSERVECISYLRRLCQDLSGVLHTEILVVGSEASVPSKQIQPIGLIVNELVTNAAKHGGGPIKVEFKASPEDDCVLRVIDEGKVLADDFNPIGSSVCLPNGLGMKLVSALARQLNWSVVAGVNPAGRGACFTTTFHAT